jgi:hypothetical protein
MRSLFFCCWLLASITSATVCSAQQVDFATQILPLLSDRCSLCHGPDEESREADLRLDLSDAVGAPTQNGGHDLVIAPGDAAMSEMIRRITSEDASERMPPPESNLQLSEKEIQLLRQWIDSGATWDQHWSFRPFRRSIPPADDQAGGATEIDRFINPRIASQGLTPNPPADRHALLRRVTLDLTGVPPTPEAIERFIADRRPDAYQRQVERLLASPEFGQRMAVPWLDAARYADTYGYQSDVYREVWPWRDWVVQAMQANMPYDKFIRWQIAGDLIDDPTRDSRLATTFNRLHRQTNEGGSVEEEFRAEYVADRVNTLGTAILGLTLECARCHDHKYDPITQQDYYELGAFFTNIDESGLYSHFTSYVPTPTLDLPTDDQQRQLREAVDRVRQAEENVKILTAQALLQVDTEPSAAVEDDHPKWLGDEVARYDFGDQTETIDVNNAIEQGPAASLIGSPEVVEGVVGNGEAGGNGLRLSGENGFSTAAGGQWDWYQPFSIAVWVKPSMHHDRAVIWHRSKAWTDAASCGYELLIEEGKLSAALIHFWPGNAVRVRAVDPLAIDRWSHVCVTSDGSGAAAGLKIFVDGREVPTETVRDKLNRTIRGGGADQLTIGNRFRDRGFKQGAVDQLRIFSRDLTPYEIGVLAMPEATDRQPASREEKVAVGNPEVAAAKHELLAARTALASIQDAIPAIMTMREEPGLHQPRILQRGQYDRPGKPVVPRVLSSIGPNSDPTSTDPQPVEESETSPRGIDQSSESGPQQNRLDLARWLTDSREGQRHPLVARVAVNRLWLMLFDRGLVASQEDFGLQGQPPSHPMLLDFLAATFIDEGWDIKRMVRRMVTSEAYRRGSTISPAAMAIDPENQWLARGPSSRLPIEDIRDSALAAGGLLERSFGGPPVKPYQPEGLWEEKSGASYQRQTGTGSHRRSMYTIWKRTSPPPSMLIFDAPGREVCVAQRTVTHTPLQALVLLNDEQFVEASRGVAFQILTADHPSEDARIEGLFQRLLGRSPSPREQEVLANLITAQSERFSKEADQLSNYLAIGDVDFKATAIARGVDPVTLGAWTVAAQTIMNLDEWVSR